MDNKTKNLFPEVDKDILKKMDEETANLEVNVAELPKKKKILKHSNVFVDDKPIEKEQEKVEVENEPQVVENKPPSPIKLKKKSYPHLEKARAVAKANREAKKQAKLEEKLGKKEATRQMRLQKQRIASKERYWKKKEQEDIKVEAPKEIFMNTSNTPAHFDGLTYEQFRKYQNQYETEKQAQRVIKEKNKLEEENKRLKKQIKTNNSFNRNPNYPDYFNTGNRFY
tara:strand:+ start:175 stop:852 length:678 start_codon:yes stop_codon:yes gene_type:complete